MVRVGVTNDGAGVRVRRGLAATRDEIATQGVRVRVRVFRDEIATQGVRVLGGIGGIRGEIATQGVRVGGAVRVLSPLAAVGHQ